MARLESREAAHAWLLLRKTRALAADSRRVASGDAFIAWPGHASDGRQYVGAALAAGASACLVEADGVEAFGFAADSRVGALRGLKAAAGDIASRFLGDAEQQARRRRRHRHQRQDLDRVVDRAGAGDGRPALRRRRHARHRRTAAAVAGWHAGAVRRRCARPA